MFKHLTILASLALCLAAPYSLHAQTLGAIKGTVTDSISGDSIAGAMVVLSTRGGSGSGMVAIDTTATNSKGAFLIDSISAGSNYSITVSAIGYLNGMDRSITIVAGETTKVDIDLSPLSIGTSAVAGLVSDSSTDLPVSSALVVLYKGTGGSGGHGGTSWTVIDSARTGVNGRYNMTALSEGSYQIAVTASGYTAYRSGNIQVPADSTITHDVALTPGPASGVHPVSFHNPIVLKKTMSGAFMLNGKQIMKTNRILMEAQGVRIERSTYNSGRVMLVR